ncbi:hypothetical protein CAPTEDRAFT_192014 [Capitella teleta]|uniref:G-protein coupled receptors family 1 profile domain-containing protein n=1 Tax=Capitella teleta TaxID=283909 RepID=R7TAT6_CAPTE|nr:hypothetical protein CAPTEDRAFT_192014 [Capitella teleta]|eukprot:ELT90627.1 hypothetical protein CAPTEDRAFT_192014 [Capitella teleta]
MFADDLFSGVTVSGDNFHDKDQNIEDGGHHGYSEVFSDISQWNTALCASLLILILTICLIFNALNAATLIHKKSCSSNSVIMLLSSCMSLVSYVILLPMTLAGVAAPKPVITETYCYVQESLTLGVILLGFFLPSLNSLNRMIVVQSGQRNWCKSRHLAGFIFGFLAVVTLSILIPLFTVKEEGSVIHEHGCHLWSVRVDPAMWFRVYTILTALALCMVTMLLSYTLIYLKVVASTNSVSNHDGPCFAKRCSVSAIANSSNATINPNPANRRHSFRECPHTAVHSSFVQTRFRRHRQVAKIAFIMIGIYVVIWIPWAVVTWMSVGSSEGSVNHELRLTTMVIGYVPAAVDPLLNVFMSPVLKAEMKKRVQKWTG